MIGGYTYRHLPPCTIHVVFNDGDETAHSYQSLALAVEALLEASAARDIVSTAKVIDSRGSLLATWPAVNATDEVLDAISELIQHRYPKLTEAAEQMHLAALEQRVLNDYREGRL